LRLAVFCRKESANFQVAVAGKSIQTDFHALRPARPTLFTKVLGDTLLPSQTH
jgi:hypothetical protein